MMTALKRIALGFALAAALSSSAFAWSAQCENAWNALRGVNGLTELHSLLANNCAILYEKGWVSGNGYYNPAICTISWNELSQQGELANAAFLVKEGCPVLCRNYGWCAD